MEKNLINNKVMIMLKTSLFGYLFNSVKYQIQNNKPKKKEQFFLN